MKLVLSLLFRPREAMPRVTHGGLVLHGLIAAIAVTLANGVVFLVASGVSMKRLPEWTLFQHGLEFIIGAALFGFLSWISGFLVSSWLVHWASQRQGGKGTFAGLMAGLGFAHIPWAGLILYMILGLADPNTFSLPLALALFLILWAWSMWLGVRAIEANYDFIDYFPAVYSLILPVIPVLILAGPGLLVVAVGVAIFSVVGFG